MPPLYFFVWDAGGERAVAICLTISLAISVEALWPSQDSVLPLVTRMLVSGG